jgi:hypothetical protein
MIGLSSLRNSEAMERRVGSVKALSAHGSWNKKPVNPDPSWRGARYDALAISAWPAAKSILDKKKRGWID